MKEWLVRVLPRLSDRERARVLVYAAVVGVLGGLSAVLFEFLMDEAARMVFGTADPALGGFSTERALAGPVLTGLCAGAAATLLTTTGRPQGIADIIGHARGAEPAPQIGNAFASTLAAVLTIGGGQSAGREGPIVQLAGSITSFVSAQAGIPVATGRVLAAASAAGAIAASFNSPLGGAFFALEVILGTFALDAFAPVVVASVAGTLVGQLVLGDHLALQLPAFQLKSSSEIFLFPLLGIACGLVTVVFRALVVFAQIQFARMPGPKLLRPAVAGLAVGLLAAAGMPDAMGNGYARLELLIGVERPAVGFLLVLLSAKLVATALSAASRAGGGMFAPSLFLGAVTGLLCGRAFAFALPGVDPDAGTFAIVGMGGVAAAIAHAPATMALMLAEMTGNYAIILPLLVTIAIASLVSRVVFRHSLYVQSLLDRGVRLDRNPEELIVHGLHADDVLSERGYLTTRSDAPVAEVVRLFLDHRQDELIVVDPEFGYVGVIDVQDVKGFLHGRPSADHGTAAKLARPIAAVRADTPLADVMEAFFVSGVASVPVVDEGGRLVGVVTERDVMGTLNREILKRDVGLARLASGPPEDRKTDFFELPTGHAVTSWSTGDVAGRSLAELDFTKRFGVVVLAIDQWDDQTGTSHRVPPRADTVLGPKDAIVVMGPADHVAGLADATRTVLGGRA
jgi:chloride channel protein, CIC family